MYAGYVNEFYNTRGQPAYYYSSNPVASLSRDNIPRRYAPTASEVRTISVPTAVRHVPVLAAVTFRHVELKAEVPEEPQQLQLTESTLDKLMHLPESVQVGLLRLIEQQHEIQLLQLKARDPTAVGIAAGGTSAAPAAAAGGGAAASRIPPIPSLKAPDALVQSKLDGKGGPLTLEEIRQLNQANLALATNQHLKSQPLQSRGLEFSDEAAVMKTLIELNPEWRDQPETLMAAMKAKLGQQPLELRVTPEGGAEQPERQVDDGWKNVKQQVTHQLQIADAEGNSVRVVPAVMVYEDPLIYVLPQLLAADECDLLLQLTAAHWQKGQAADAPAAAAASSGCGVARLPRGKNDFCERLLHRAAAALQCPADELEDLHMIRYPEGAKNEEHVDSVRRCSTLIVYLNDLPTSGQTDFSKLGFQIQPQKGTAVFWHNVLKDEEDRWTQKSDERTAHASLESQGGPKTILVAYRKNSTIAH